MIAIENPVCPEEIQEACFADLRNCIQAHPKLIYPLLAVVSGKFHFMKDRPALLFHFYAPDPSVQDFIRNLTMVFYGKDNCRNTTDLLQDSSVPNSAGGTYYLDTSIFGNPFVRVRPLEEVFHTAGYRRRQYVSDYDGNTIITTTEYPDETCFYTAELRQDMIYFQTDLLDRNTSVSPLEQFRKNCSSGEYHGVLNFSANNNRHTMFWKSCKEEVRYSLPLKKRIRKHPHLQQQADVLLASVIAVRKLLGIPVSDRAIENLLIRNFKLYQKTELAADILANGDMDDPLGYLRYSIPERKEIPQKKEWIGMEVHIEAALFQEAVLWTMDAMGTDRIWPLRYSFSEKRNLHMLRRKGLLKMDGIHPHLCKCLFSLGDEDAWGDCYTLYLMDGDITVK